MNSDFIVIGEGPHPDPKQTDTPTITVKEEIRNRLQQNFNAAVPVVQRRLLKDRKASAPVPNESSLYSKGEECDQKDSK